MLGKTMYDVAIIGGGPAGLSAALALGRVCRRAIVFDSGSYRNNGSQSMHTVLSRDGMNPMEFQKIGREQIQSKYDSITFSTSKIVKASKHSQESKLSAFELEDSEGKKHHCRKLILATGKEDLLPNEIEGYRENWPEHIYQCLFCDGFEQKSYSIGILGFNPGYVHLASMALGFNRDVTIYSNGPVARDQETQKALKSIFALNIKLEQRPVRRLINNGKGPEKGISIEFTDGSLAKLGMLLHRPAMKNRAQDLIDQLGLETREMTGDVVVDPMFSQASVPGCFVIGDSADPIKQVGIAIGAGVRAGASASFMLTSEDNGIALAKADNFKLEQALSQAMEAGKA